MASSSVPSNDPSTLPTETSTAVPTDDPPTSTTNPTIHIGTRKSALALIQTNIVHKALSELWPAYNYEIHSMSTIGDKDKVTPLHNFNAKALWTHELEGLLLEEELDLIVHSLKGITFPTFPLINH